MTQITNTRAIILGNMEGKGDLMLKPASKTGHETIFLRKRTTTVFHKIADFARGIKKADAQVKDFLDTKKSGGSTLQHIKSFLDDNKTYEFTKNKDVVFMSTPLSIADIKNAEQLKVVIKNSVIGGSERKIYDEIKIPDYFDTAAKTSFRVAIEKNIRGFLNQNRENKKVGVPEKKIESTAALFANVVVDLLENNIYQGIDKQVNEEKALLLKFFETLPDNIQTKLKELNPITFENEISSPEKEKTSQNENGIRVNTIPSKEILNDRTKLKELHTNYLKSLSVSELNTKENGSIENQALNFSSKIIDFLYDDKTIDEPSIEKLISYKSKMPSELQEKISEKFTSLVKNNEGIPIDTQILMLTF